MGFHHDLQLPFVLTWSVYIVLLFPLTTLILYLQVRVYRDDFDKERRDKERLQRHLRERSSQVRDLKKRYFHYYMLDCE